MDALAEENGNGQESWASFEQIRALIHHYIPTSITLISHEVPLFSDVIFLCSTSRKGKAEMCSAHDFGVAGPHFFFKTQTGMGLNPWSQ
jgi:hypothetical protein